MPRGPFNQKIAKDERKVLASRLRDVLRATPMHVGAMADALDVEPEVVVIALRELRTRKRGTLRSTIRLGHVHWWWEPPAVPEPKPAPGEAAAAPAKPKKGRKKDRKKGKEG